MGAADRVAVIGHAGALRERQLPLARAEDRHPVDPVERGDLVGQAHFLQIADRAGGQAVAARFVARKVGLVQHDDLRAGLRGLPRGGRARRAATRDDQVVSLSHNSRLIVFDCRSDSTQVGAGHLLRQSPGGRPYGVFRHGLSRSETSGRVQ